MNDPIQTRGNENRLEIAASLQEVWDALTKGELLTRWFGNDAKDATPGGRFYVSWFEHGAIDTPITVFEPLKHLRFADAVPGSPVPFATDFFLEAQGGVTVLRIVASGFSTEAKWDGEFDAITKGWGYFIRNLKFYLENFKGRPCRTIGLPVRQKVDRDAAFVAFCRALGLEPAALEVGKETIALGGMRARPDVLIPPGHLGLVIEGEALLRIENFDSGKGGCWAYVMGLDWGEDAARLAGIEKAMRALSVASA